MTTTTVKEGRTAAPEPGNKSRRVRTGCLTCRERHLKCDEASPHCLNCRKSNRVCKRGIRLNFLEVNVHNPRFMPFAKDWAVGFQDESRQIASEYQGGLGRYPTVCIGGKSQIPLKLEAFSARKVSAERSRRLNHAFNGPFTTHFPQSVRRSETQPFRLRHMKQSYFGDRSNLETGRKSRNRETTNPLPETGGIQPKPFSLPRPFCPDASTFAESHVAVKEEAPPFTCIGSDKSSEASIMPQVTNAAPSVAGGSRNDSEPNDIGSPSSINGSQSGEREYLGSPEEVHYMQVFVDEVGVWMDSFDRAKHFSQIIPYQALKSPMLLNACLACGVIHQSRGYQAMNGKALSYYNTATTQLLRTLQNPDRNMSECATAAVILNVYETMADTQTKRMYHAAGARALIRDCGWNATSGGIGAACFWLSIEMEVMNCLVMNWPTAWDPDEWGVDMEMGDEEDVGSIGKEEAWVHKIFYILAKVANFRVTTTPLQEWSPHDEPAKQGVRFAQWEQLKDLCTRWNNACPRTMHPIGYLDPAEAPSSCSRFPKVWLIKRPAVISRLFYHTARCILAQTAPPETPRIPSAWHETQVHHARQVCGIIAHTKDSGIASVAAQCAIIVGPVLGEKGEQGEILQMLEEMTRKCGLCFGNLEVGLKETWGWGSSHPQRSSSQPGQSLGITEAGHTLGIPAKAELAGPACLAFGSDAGTTNPLNSADFSLPDHPYQNWYEPPNRTNDFSPPLF